MPAEPPFKPGHVLDLFARRAVRVIVVGAFAAQIRRIDGIVTRDLDVTPDLDAENLQELAEALHAMGATVRTEPHAVGPVRLPPDGGLIARVPILNLHLPGFGDVDVIHAAANATEDRGPLDYVRLSAGATVERLPDDGPEVLVMSEDDWLESKRTPPVRDKDRIHLVAYDRWRRARA
jgi:hypothetical protein